MELKRTAAVCLAAALLITSSGCTAVKKYTVASDDEAYKRELYPEGDYSSAFDEETSEDEENADENDNDKKAAEKKSDNKSKDKNKDKDKEKDKKEKSEDSGKSKPESKAESSKTVSSRTVASRAEQPRVSSTKKTVSKANSSRANLSYTSSKIPSVSSDTDSDTDKEDTDILPSPTGSFSAYDTAYYTKKGIIYPGECEEYILRIMGDPNEEYFSEDGLEKSLSFDKCEMSFYYDDTDKEFILYRVQIPKDSMYETSKMISTEIPVRTVLRTYGTPTKIIKVEDDEWSSLPAINKNNNSSTPKATADTPSYQTWVYLYTSGDCSLVLFTQHNEVIAMEYRFEGRTDTHEGD
ncbi:MAG: hypothetical protein IIZ59_01260 [Clostridia bacterium]|nr:hypothetical protein [Clostridia bacterium]